MQRYRLRKINLSNTYLQIAIALFLLGAIGDTVTTYYGMQSPVFTERNPFLRHLFGQYGVLAPLILGKLLVSGLYLTYPQLSPKYNTELAAISFLVGAALYLYATLNNILVLTPL